MNELADGSVHMVCTSPPYWGLRKYAGVPDLVFGGDENCQHEWGDKILHPQRKSGKHSSKSIVAEGTRIAEHEVRINSNQGQFCLKCSAWRGQLGQEPTPELYIKHIVNIFQEVKRVLRSDGVCFINIGDSYAANRSYQVPDSKWTDVGNFKSSKVPKGLKPADKCLVPFRLAIALQENGWWVRQDIIWQKNNPMPESVSSPRWVKHRVKIKKSKRDLGKGNSGAPQGDSRHNPDSLSQWQDCPGCVKCLPNDGLVLRHGSWRPTESHEYILMLTKTNDYYADGFAVRELGIGADSTRATNFTSLGSATIGMELLTTVKANQHSLQVWRGCYLGNPQNTVYLAMAFNTDQLKVNSDIGISIILKQAEGHSMMDLEYGFVSRNTANFTLIIPLGSDSQSDLMPILSSIINSPTFPHRVQLAHLLTTLPQVDTPTATKVMTFHILSVTPEILTAEITFDKEVFGTPLNIFATFRSTSHNNIIPQSTSGRNLRSVWTFSTQSYGGNHYATFPEKLPELCIKAGTSEYGVCAECGKPWARILNIKTMVIKRSNHAEKSRIRIMSSGTMEEPNQVTTLGWRATCKCKTGKVIPATVLDPFCGTGTTLYVAGKLGRQSIGYELSEDYCRLALERNRQMGLGV